ncbi:MAG: hypothetical protein ABIW84_03245, partial [Ilumatobacteraceae bacterium]
ALEEANTTIDDALDSLGVQDSAPLKQLLEDVGEAFSDFSLNGIVVDKVDGSWYVSPIGTSFETLLSVLRALDRDEIETLINDTQDVIEGAFGGFSMPGIDDFPDDVPGDTVPADTFPDDTFPDDTVPVDSTTDDTIPTESASWYDCLDQFESPEQLGACITSGVADGTFAAEDIPAPFLFPQCGLLEYYNSDELFNDDADAFNATIDAGRQCILDAAGAAGVDISFTSPEFTNPECYLTDNPYNYEDDDVSETDGFTCVLES